MTNTDPGAPEYKYGGHNPSEKTFDFGRVFSRAFTGVFANVKPLLIAMAIAIAFTFVVSVISSSQMRGLFDGTNIESAASNPAFWFWTYGASIPTLFLTLWVQLIVVETSYSEFTGTSQPASPLTSALKYILPMFVVAFIYTVVSVLGFYALFIGFVFVWPGWALAGPILVHEKAGIFGSIGEAWRLSSGSKRWIFLLLFLLSIIGIIIYSVLSAVAVIVTGANLYSGDPTAAFNMSIMQQALLTLISGVGGYFVYSIFASGLTAAYVEVKTLRDGAPNVSEVFS